MQDQASTSGGLTPHGKKERVEKGGAEKRKRREKEEIEKRESGLGLCEREGASRTHTLRILIASHIAHTGRKNATLDKRYPRLLGWT